jgi:DNA repair protein RadC
MMMNQSTNEQLLSILLGDEGEMFAKRSLAELFGLKAVRQNVNQIAEKSLNYVAPSKLFAARELLRRALEENMADEACSFNSPAAVKDYLRLHLGGREEEHFVAIWLDAQHRLIAVDSLFRGTLSQTSVYPREVVKSGLKFNACSVIFAHNHPSGVTESSSSDRMLTEHLKGALALVDIKVIDHMIVGDNKIMSFAETGII